MKISVVIPTYRRPDMLRQAVSSLFAGTRYPDEVIIVGRKSDHETVEVIEELQQHPDYSNHIKSAWVTIPGHIPPVETGFKTASGDIVAVIDDDVTVTSGWLAQISSHFIDPLVGVVGGQVIVPGRPPAKIKGKPGRLTWYGKIWGNIWLVEGASPLQVILLMEGNWAWRQDLITSLEFDPMLNFDVASNYGLDLTFQVHRRNFKVLYDPQSRVYHHVSPHIPELDRTDHPRRLFGFCRNYTYILLKHLPWWRKVIFLAWWFLIGGRQAMGLGLILASVLHSGIQRRREFGVAIAGRVEGVRLWLKYHCS